MKSKTNEWTLRIVAALVVLSLSVGAQGQNWSHKDKKFSGVINAYTPQTTTQNPTTGQTTVTGPYEIRGPWSLKLKKDGTKADFSAELNMEFSDGWVLSVNKGNFDPTMRNAHTHHITLTDVDVAPIANGFQVTGIATFTLSGNPAPPTVAPSAVVINITGGTEVEFSNITLTFLSPGSNHFGTAPLPGVVRSVKEEK
jgi:hypothetical protein